MTEKPTQAFLFIFLLVLSGCTPRSSESPQPEQLPEITNAVNYWLINPVINKSALLAAKYGIPEDTALTIATNYLQKCDFIFSILASGTNRTPVEPFGIVPAAQELQLLTQQTGIPKDKIAAFLVDLQMWTAAERAENAARD